MFDCNKNMDFYFMRVITNFSFSVIFKTMANIWRVALIKAVPSKPPIFNYLFFVDKNVIQILRYCANIFLINTCMRSFVSLSHFAGRGISSYNTANYPK